MKGNPASFPEFDEVAFAGPLLTVEIVHDGDVLRFGTLHRVGRQLGHLADTLGHVAVRLGRVTLRADVVGSRAGRHAGDHTTDGSDFRARGEVHGHLVVGESRRQLRDRSDRVVEVEDVARDGLVVDPLLDEPLANRSDVRGVVGLVLVAQQHDAVGAQPDRREDYPVVLLAHRDQMHSFGDIHGRSCPGVRKNIVPT